MAESQDNRALISYDEFSTKAKTLKKRSDVTNFVKELIVPTLQKMLEAELKKLFEK
jgi:hypothetical protein